MTGDVKVVKTHEPYHLQISTVNPEHSLKIHEDSKKKHIIIPKDRGDNLFVDVFFLGHILGFLPKEIGDATMTPLAWCMNMFMPAEGKPH